MLDYWVTIYYGEIEYTCYLSYAKYLLNKYPDKFFTEPHKI